MTWPPRSARRPSRWIRPRSSWTAYKAGGYNEPYAAYGAQSYDAANAIIKALKVSLARTLRTPSPPWQATITEVGKVSFDGATGKVDFDEFGDTTTKTMTAYKVKGGKWVADKTGT